MEEISRDIDVDKLISYGTDLIQLLRDGRDADILKNCAEKYDTLQSHCRSDYIDTLESLEDYQKKIDVIKQKTATAKDEVASDAEIDLLQSELDGELQRHGLLREEIRVIANQMHDLECQTRLIEERRQVLKKIEKEETKAQMKLSMYASVTNVIPNLNDHSTISGHIIGKEKKVVEKFKFSSQEMTDFETCKSIWTMISR